MVYIFCICIITFLPYEQDALQTLVHMIFR